jgi:hypothetical protein
LSRCLIVFLNPDKTNAQEFCWHCCPTVGCRDSHWLTDKQTASALLSRLGICWWVWAVFLTCQCIQQCDCLIDEQVIAPPLPALGGYGAQHKLEVPWLPINHGLTLLKEGDHLQITQGQEQGRHVSGQPGAVT